MLTPREFRALERVHEQCLHRWAFERAHAANLAGAHHSSGRAFHPDDFIETRESRARRIQADRDAADLARAQREERQQMVLMKAGTFPEDQLPVWARMTPGEKAARGIK